VFSSVCHDAQAAVSKHFTSYNVIELYKPVYYCTMQDAAYCYRCSMFAASVCLLVTTVSCTKTAEPVDMPFGIWTRVGLETMHKVHEETRELPGERDNARNNARCTQARKTMHGLDGQCQDMDRTLYGRVSQNDRGQR